jgi:broad-specificity NMP kinase
MQDLIVIAGSPGSGKTTLATSLKDKFASPWVDYGRLREFHLDQEWKKADDKEEQLTFENLLFIVRNYLKHGYKNVIVDDLRDFRIQQIPEEFKNSDYIILSLVANDAEIEKRITARNDGWKSVPDAQAWNNSLKNRVAVANEHRIDTVGKTPEEVLNEALGFIEA